MDTPTWQDTILLPPNGNVVFRTVMHCHFSDHEDFGMMAIVEVV